jgi:xylulokinase
LTALLGIDIGTSGTKSVLFDVHGVVLASSMEEYPMYQPHNGWAEQDPEDWWNATVHTCREVLRTSGINASEIKGIGLSGQMHGLVMLNQNSDVLRDSIIWCDQRTGEECLQITNLVGAEKLIQITANPALTGFTASKILWVRNHEPALYSRCTKILLPKDYIRYKLTGEFATDVSDASGMQLLDVKERAWSLEVLNDLNIDPSLLATVYESPEITGKITKIAAEQTGLAEGTIVVGGAGDNAAAAVGMGVVEDEKAFTTIGTSGVVYAHTSEMKLDLLGRVHTFCCAVPGEWHVMGVTQAAGLSLQWFKINFCADEIKEAEQEQKDPYEIMTAEASEVPLGSDKLIYAPYLMGERTPHLDPDCRGVFFGLTASHKRAHMIRAIMEGVSFSLTDCVKIIQEMGIEFKDMLVCGGGGRSKLWRSMIADTMDMSVKITGASEGPALGAAILAGVGAGVFSSVNEGCKSIVRYAANEKPNKKNHLKYMAFYSIYRNLYKVLRNEFKELVKL